MFILCFGSDNTNFKPKSAQLFLKNLMKLSTLLKNLLNERMQEKIREKAEFLDSSDIFSAQIRLKKYLETNQDKEFKCHGMFYDFKNFGGARNHIVMNLCCQISLENGEEEFINSIAPFTGKQTDRMVGAGENSFLNSYGI